MGEIDGKVRRHGEGGVPGYLSALTSRDTDMSVSPRECS